MSRLSASLLNERARWRETRERGHPARTLRPRRPRCIIVQAHFAAVALSLGLASTARAQNVTGYASIPNPYLLLLREPAVHDDLRLTPEQRTELRRVNDEVDGRKPRWKRSWTGGNASASPRSCSAWAASGRC
jgi:hypothetical protein